MLILTIRTDKPDAEIGLFDSEHQIAYEMWFAHRELSVTILQKIESMLASSKLDLTDLKGIVAYKGPGSFTGLRIGMTVANTLSYALNIPVIGSQGTEWIQSGITNLTKDSTKQYAMPDYGSDAHITAPRK